MAGGWDGHSTALTISGFTAALISIDGVNLSRDEIETSTMATTSRKTFIPGSLSDPGSIDCTFDFDPAMTPPIDGAAATITITWPNTDGSTWAASGFMTNFSAGAMINERMTATGTLKLAGDWEITAAPA